MKDYPVPDGLCSRVIYKFACGAGAVMPVMLAKQTGILPHTHVSTA